MLLISPDLGSNGTGEERLEVSKAWHLTSTETVRLIRDGEKVGAGGEIIYLLLHCHHQNDSCIKMGSGESHFNVSLILRDKGHTTVSTDHNF